MKKEVDLEKEKFYQTTKFCVITLILFFPIGLFCMWKNKKFTKKIRVLISGILVVLFLVGINGGVSTFTNEVNDGVNNIVGEINSSESKEDNTVDEEDTIVIERENIIGVSNKDFKEISKDKPVNVRNDITGNWRIVKTSEGYNIEDYALSYYESNFKSDDEIHAVVNFSLNTTTRITVLFDNIIDVTVLEYVDKEEHDAKKLFGGNVLAEYWIYTDNGDIEKVQ